VQHAKQMEGELFADVIKKIQHLSASQQNFIQEMLSHPKSPLLVSKKTLLKRSYGLWAGRKDISDSIEYVDNIRRGWESRLKRVQCKSR
jgi:hypothetical protein